MPPLSFFKPSMGVGSGEHRGGITRESIGRPRALSNTGFDHPGYSLSSSFSDVPVFALERPSTPPQPNLINAHGGIGLARSASASGMGGSSPVSVYSHGSPGKYNPARLLRRKASRRGEREDAWESVISPINISAPTHSFLPPGAAPPAIPNTSSNNSASTSTATTPSLTVSPPSRPWGSPPSRTSEMPTDARSIRSRVGRTYSGSGIPQPPGPPSSLSTTMPPPNFGSVRSVLSVRSVHSDAEADTISSQPSVHGGSGMSALAAAFEPPVSAHNIGSAHPFLAQVHHQGAGNNGGSAANSAPGTEIIQDSPTFSSTLSPPKRPPRPNPPPPPRVTHSQGGSFGSVGSADATHHSRPGSLSSNASGGSDTGIAKDTAEWLARKPSGRRRIPLATAFSTTNLAAAANGTLVGNDQAQADRRIRRVASQSSAHVMRTRASYGPESLSANSAFGLSRQSFGPASFGMMGVTADDSHVYPARSGTGDLSPMTSSVNSNSSVGTVVSGANSSSDGRQASTPLEAREHMSTPPPPTVSSDRPYTPDSSSPRRGENYDVSVSCTPGEDEVRWEIVVRRVPGGGYMPPPGPLALNGPSTGKTTSLSRVNAPPLASSVNLSLGLDIDQPTGKLVFIALPDSNSTPTRLRSRSSASPRSIQPYVYLRGAPSTLGALNAACESGESSSSVEGKEIPPSTLSPVSETMPSVLSPSTPGTPATPATPSVTDPATLVDANPLSPRALKRRGRPEMFPISTITVAPPPPPRKDHRRASAASSPITTPNSSANSTPPTNSPTLGIARPTASPNVTSEGPSPADTPSPSATGNSTPIGTRPFPIRPDRPSRRVGTASIEISSPGGLTPNVAHGPMASINGGKSQPSGRQHAPTLGLLRPVADSLRTIGNGDHLDSMEHIVTPISARSSNNDFDMEIAR